MEEIQQYSELLINCKNRLSNLSKPSISGNHGWRECIGRSKKESERFFREAKDTIEIQEPEFELQ